MIEWFEMHTYVVFAILITFWTGFFLYHYRGKVHLTIWQVIILAILHTCAGFACAKVFAGLEAFRSPLDVGYSLFGCMFGLPLFYWIAAKLLRKDSKDIFDVFTICLIGSLAIIRVNCLFAGCCLGRHFPGSELLRLPTRELEILFQIILIVYFVRKFSRVYVRGSLLPQYMMLYGAFRFIEEWFRDNGNPYNYLHIGHVWSVIIFVTGSSIYLELKVREKNERTGRRRKV